LKEKENDKILSGCVFFSLIILPYNINAYSQSILSVLQVIFHAHIFSVLLKMNNPFAFKKIMMRKCNAIQNCDDDFHFLFVRYLTYYSVIVILISVSAQCKEIKMQHLKPENTMHYVDNNISGNKFKSVAIKTLFTL